MASQTTRYVIDDMQDYLIDNALPITKETIVLAYEEVQKPEFRDSSRIRLLKELNEAIDGIINKQIEPPKKLGVAILDTPALPYSYSDFSTGSWDHTLTYVNLGSEAFFRTYQDSKNEGYHVAV